MPIRTALTLLDNRITTYEALVAQSPDLKVPYSTFIEDLKDLRDILTPKLSAGALADRIRQEDIEAAKLRCAYCRVEFEPNEQRHVLGGSIPLYFHHHLCWPAVLDEQAKLLTKQKEETNDAKCCEHSTEE